MTYPDEITEKTVYIEGSVKQILVNRYERDKDARNKCISHYGPICTICDFDFNKQYGDIGAGFIHVHHLVKISDIKQEYQIHPIKDLRPVCPNCHAMIHKKDPHYSIEELKEIMLNKK
ncbi:MAG: restriction endonuclease [Sulfuricurvum sp. RIFCSPLOWO2_12_FULL_43_24]|nr:MAG: restriction endonuclease [Sulfuricurvum sp. RIFCSPLOWO2_12_FULL_43_24]